LGGIVLLSVSSFTVLATWQYADPVIAFFMLSSIVALSLYDASPTDEHTGFLILAGAAAGFCAWTKNEGLLFLLLFVTVRLLFQFKLKGLRLCAREAAAMMLGLLPVLAAVAYFKLGVTPANYYLRAGANYSAGPMQHIIQPFLDSETTRHKLTDISRYWLIAKTMAGYIGRFGGGRTSVTLLLAFYLISGGVKRNSVLAVQTGIAVLALMLIGYFFVYLTTPFNLTHHMSTSLLRLLLQLWPSSVFVFFVATSDRRGLAYMSG
jgi:hypothetical protein